jgi:hypothetical protein
MTLLNWTIDHSRQHFIQLLILAVFVATSLITAHGQGASATLSGTVSDPNGAVVPGVNIAVINIGQGFQRTTITTAEGSFVVPLLPPGNYNVKAEREGFTPAEVRNVVLNVNDHVSLAMELKVGSIGGNTVTVLDRVSLVKDSATIETTVDRTMVANLPLNGRSFQSLIASITPGVVLTKANGGEGGQFSINGQRSDANYVTVDGVSANVGVSPAFGLGQGAAGSLPALSASGGSNNLVSVDALQEFKVLTSTYAPEFGRTPGGQIQIVTRSGTNDFHGTLFDYIRNDVFDANDTFANANRLQRPALRQNDFGGVVGGPLFLPRFGEGGRAAYNGRDRTFFFFSYEGLRLRLPQTLVSNVPSLATRETASPQIQPFLNAFPRPNGRVLTNGVAEFSASFSNPSQIDATSIRIDHNFQQVNLFVRYNYSPTNTITRGGNFSLNTLNPASITTRTLTAGFTWTPTASLGNDFRTNWTKLDAATEFFIDGLGGAVIPPDSLLFPPGSSRSDAIFILNFASGTAGLQWDIGTNASNSQQQFNVVDNLSLSHGQHQLKFGVDYRRLSPDFGPRNYAQIVSFDDVASTRSALASSVSVSSATGGSLRFHNLSFYGQDTWKPMRRLTLTYGLRWEINPSPSETHGNGPFAITETPGNSSSLSLAPANTQLYKTTFNNFAPRFGFAWQARTQPGRETILRGGFGVFYDLGTGPAGDILVGFPYLGNKFLSNVPFPLSTVDATPPALVTNPISAITSFDPKLKLPYTYQFNATAQQAIGSDQTVSIVYIGAIGRRLLRRERLISPTPQFTTVTLIRNLATSDYHSLQMQYVRRLSKGFQAVVSYTWSHSLDNASNDSTAWLPGSRIDPRNERGPSDFDVRHALTGATSYDLPNNRVTDNPVLRGWSLDGLFSVRSATPVNVVTGAVFFGVGSALRPDLLAGVPLYIHDPNVAGGKKINRNAFVIPSGRQGSLGRNALRGFPMWQVDLALRRQFALSEKVSLQVRAEAFNLFNHPNFGDPGARATQTNSLASALFGQSILMLGKSLGSGGIQPGLNPLYQVGGPRSMQFALKMTF